MELRDYQSAAVQAVYDYFAAGRGDAPLVVAPTGAGKSVIIAEFMRRALADYPGTRILLATHVKELVAQNCQALLRLWPSAPAGIYSAGLGQRRARAQLVFASVQSVAKRAKEIGHVDLMMVDEAHLVPAKGEGQYRTLIDGLRWINPDMRLVGCTATPYRLTTGMLHRGEGRIFDGIAYDIPVGMLVQRGYLAPLVSKRPDQTFDLAGLHKRGGEFIDAEMADRFATDATTRAAVAEIVAAGQDRRAWITFCITVAHADQVRDEIRRHGITCETVHGGMDGPTRDRILRGYKAGLIRCLTSVAVLTTGFDAPITDLLAFLRPTASTGLYIQMAGRGMRIAHGKANCLVLDFAGNVERHGPVDAITLPDERKPGGGGMGEMAAPTKTCPECREIVHAAVRECSACGFLWPEPERAIESTASTAAIMNLTAVDDWQPVTDMALDRHEKDGRVSMRVEYLVGGKVIREWVCFEHSGRPREMAVWWWQTYAGTPPPDSVAEALARQAEVRRPAEAVVRREGKFDRIARVRGEAGRVAA
jgi:DNA repair protein RadD